MVYGVMDFFGGIFMFCLLFYLLHMTIGGIIAIFHRYAARDQDITIRFK
jgi:hypothetical protein